MGKRAASQGRRGPGCRLADLVARFDEDVARAAATTGSEHWLRLLARLSNAANHSKLWMAIAATLAVLGGRRGRRAAQRAMLVIGLTSPLVNLVMKPVFPRSRPPVRPDALSLVRRPVSSSFPSGHAASAAAFATAVAMEAPAIAAPAVVLAAGVGYSRVSTGVHHPSDVLAGGLVGTSIALASARVWPRINSDAATAKPAARRHHTSTLPAAGDGLVVVVNAGSGSGGHDGRVCDIAERFPAARVHVVEDPSTLLDELSRAVDGADALGIVGGDGAVGAAAATALDHDVPLAVFPGGTLNHFARDLGIATVDDTLDAIASGTLVEVDAATIDGRVFLNTASLGTYSAFVTARERLEARLGKWPATFLALARVLRTARPSRVEFDGQATQAWMVFIGNCAYDPPGFVPATRECLDDGHLDIRIVDGGPRLARLRFLAALLTGQLARSRVYMRRLAPALCVSTRERGPVLAADGETFAGSDTFTIGKHPTPLRVYVPG